MPDANRHRVLVISQSTEVRNELVTLLSGYGYFVEYCQSRIEGLRKFRAHKQPIVIVDMSVLRGFPKRLFKFIQSVRKNTIVLIAAGKAEEREAFEKLSLGAYDILNLPLKTDSLKSTLKRAMDHHRVILENIFVKNTVFFGLLVLPIWAMLGYLLLK
jgi:two-component system, NtrC family, C4-dicarboxylate transport response regulator DctD